MTTYDPQVHRAPQERTGVGERSTTLRATTIGGSTVEALGGVGALVLAILGLTVLDPKIMASIALIAAGGALLFRGLEVASKARVMSRSASEEGAMVAGGLSVEVAAGLAGVALGVLALLDVEPITLLAAGVTALGAALIFGAGANQGLAVMGTSSARGPSSAMGTVSEASVGGNVLIGIGVAALGVIALVGIVPETLVLCGLVAFGAGAVVEALPPLARAMGIGA